MYASPMRRFFVLCVLIAGAIGARAESPSYLVFVSNERSGDVTVINGTTDAVVATLPVGKRPRGIHAALGLEMPVFPKRRFQHGSVAAKQVARLFPQDETRYRRHFEKLHTAVV